MPQGALLRRCRGSPDPLVRELIAIDTLLKELNCRITIQFEGCNCTEDFPSFIPLCSQTLAFHPPAGAPVSPGQQIAAMLSNRHIVGPRSSCQSE